MKERGYNILTPQSEYTIIIIRASVLTSLFLIVCGSIAYFYYWFLEQPEPLKIKIKNGFLAMDSIPLVAAFGAMFGSSPNTLLIRNTLFPTIIFGVIVWISMIMEEKTRLSSSTVMNASGGPLPDYIS